MKKTLSLLIALTGTSLFAGFDFNTCSGSGTFEQEIVHYGGNYENAITVGEIPQGIQGLKINLISDKDVDIRLYADNGDKIVHWPRGILNGAVLATKPYQDVNVTYSGYNGTGGEKGHEFIEVEGTTPTAFTMKAFGYRAGNATVNYSWTGKEGCTPTTSGTGTFEQTILNKATNLVGTIPPHVENVEINLTSDNDLDIQLYAQDGTAIARWNPAGLMAGATQQSVMYHDMNITWSGYNGVNNQKGHEYITIEGNTTEMLTMKVYGYQAGVADVVYSWGESNTYTMGSIGIGDSIFPKMGNGGYDVLHYDIQLDWDSETNYIEATTTISAKALQDLSGFYLDFYQLTIDTIKVNGDPIINYIRKGEDIKIPLSSGEYIDNGEEFNCSIKYHGVPTKYPDIASGWHLGGWEYDETHKTVTTLSQPNSSINWFPSNNHSKDKATYSFAITVPKDYVAVANGTHTNTITDGLKKTFYFSENKPMVTYGATVCIADFRVEEKIGSQTGLLVSNYIENIATENTYFLLDYIDNIIAIYVDALGPYPFDLTGGIFIRNHYLALENQSRQVYHLSAITNGREYLLPHEIAHQWFGNSLSMSDLKDAWLNEGMATFAHKFIYRYYKNSLKDAVDAMRQEHKNVLMNSEISTSPANRSLENGLFSSTVYSRGALVIYALLAEVGKDTFFSILKTYISRYAHKNVTTEDFISVAEEVSHRDLTDLFDAWLFADIVPDVFPELNE